MSCVIEARARKMVNKTANPTQNAPASAALAAVAEANKSRP